MYLGMQCQWAIWYQPLNGAFIESIESNQLSFKYGHPGCSRGRRPLQPSWAVCAQMLELTYLDERTHGLLLICFMDRMTESMRLCNLCAHRLSRMGCQRSTALMIMR